METCAEDSPVPRDEEDDLPGGDDDPDNEGRRPGKRAATAAKPKPPEPEEEESEDETEAPARHQHIPRLVKLAKAMGIAQAEIDATPTEQLWLAVQNEHAISLREREARHPEPAPKAAEPVPDEDELDFEVEDVAEDGTRKKRKAKVTDYDPLVQKLHRENKDLKKWREEKEKSDLQRERNSLFAKLDEGFEGLEPEERAFFGEGTMADLHAAGLTDEIARRTAVVGVSGVRDDNTDSQRAIDRKLRAGIKKVYPGGAKAAKPAAEEQELADYGATPSNGQARKPMKKPGKAQRWGESTVARPTARRGSALPRGRAAADKAVRDWMVEHGHDPGPASDTAEHDELPGDDVI